MKKCHSYTKCELGELTNQLVVKWFEQGPKRSTFVVTILDVRIEVLN